MKNFSLVGNGRCRRHRSRDRLPEELSQSCIGAGSSPAQPKISVRVSGRPVAYLTAFSSRDHATVKIKMKCRTRVAERARVF